jgi:hypothetical protein
LIQIRHILIKMKYFSDFSKINDYLSSSKGAMANIRVEKEKLNEEKFNLNNKKKEIDGIVKELEESKKLHERVNDILVHFDKVDDNFERNIADLFRLFPGVPNTISLKNQYDKNELYKNKVLMIKKSCNTKLEEYDDNLRMIKNRCSMNEEIMNYKKGNNDSDVICEFAELLNKYFTFGNNISSLSDKYNKVKDEFIIFCNIQQLISEYRAKYITQFTILEQQD